jgi:hypothetical protein
MSWDRNVKHQVGLDKIPTQHWAWWEQIAGSSYVILAVTVLLGVAYVARRHTRTAAEEPARVQLVADGHSRDEFAPDALLPDSQAAR